jgi:hypothetical protein
MLVYTNKKCKYKQICLNVNINHWLVDKSKV